MTAPDPTPAGDPLAGMTPVAQQLLIAIGETTETLRVLTLALRAELAGAHAPRAAAAAEPAWPATFDDDDEVTDAPA